jgi:mRNA interferase RelE/StbE
MFVVRITAEAQAEFESLPSGMQPRIQDVFHRLARYPAISGIKALKSELKGAYRIRAGDWRVLFTVDKAANQITVFRIANRRDVYE